MSVFDVSAFNKGERWPPRLENDTLGQYHAYSSGNFAGLTELPEPRLTPNIFRFLENFWSEAALSDPPVVEVESAASGVSDLVLRINKNMPAALRMAVKYMIRYGSGFLLNRLAYYPQAVDSRWVFPIVQPQYQELTGTNVIAYGYTTDPLNAVSDRLHVEIHTDGMAEVSERELEGTTIGGTLETSNVVSGDPAIVVLSEDGTLFGRSDFIDMIPFVAELQRRGSAISKALDAHASPHLALPEDTLDVDNNGIAKLNLDVEGSYITYPADSRLPAYVTWSPEFESHQKAAEDADLRILRMARIAPILVNAWQNTGGIASGAALRRLAIPTIQRLRVIREQLSRVIAQTIAGNAKMLATPVTIEEHKIKVNWPLPLSTGAQDEAEAFALLVEHGLLDRQAAVRLINSVSEKEAQRITSKWLEDQGSIADLERPGV